MGLDSFKQTLKSLQNRMSADHTLSVLVTGATGFLAAHIIQQLQEAGHRVRATVRDLKQEMAHTYLYDLCPYAQHALELVEADLTKHDGWKEAIDGCRYVIHCASPTPVEDPKDETDIIRPAVEGTLTLLQNCLDAGGVQRVVMTSSVTAITAGEVTGTYNEEDWLDPKTTKIAYYKSKAMAEKAAWDFITNIRDPNKFSLVVLNPGYMMGNVLSHSNSPSMDLTKKLLERDMSALPKVNFPIVDVRDVARAHVVALTIPEAANKRHILVAKNMWMKDIAEIYDEEFNDFGYSVPTSESPYIVAKVVSFCDKGLESLLPAWEVKASYDTERMTSVLGVRTRPPKATLLDMAYSMIDRGFIKKTSKYQEIRDRH